MAGSSSSVTRTVHFKIHFNTAYGERVVVAGSCPELGAWSVASALPLTYDAGWWTGSVVVAAPRAPSETSSSYYTVTYKYAVVNSLGLRWEHGGDRTLCISPLRVADDTSLAYAVRDTWRVRA